MSTLTSPTRHPLAYGHIRPVAYQGQTLYHPITTLTNRQHYGEVWDAHQTVLYATPVLATRDAVRAALEAQFPTT